MKVNNREPPDKILLRVPIAIECACCMYFWQTKHAVVKAALDLITSKSTQINADILQRRYYEIKHNRFQKGTRRFPDRPCHNFRASLNQPIDSSEIDKVRRSRDIEALKLCKYSLFKDFLVVSVNYVT